MHIAGAAAPGAAGARSVRTAPARGGREPGGRRARGAGYVNYTSPVRGLQAGATGGGGARKEEGLRGSGPGWEGAGAGGEVTRRWQRLCRGDNVLGDLARSPAPPRPRRPLARSPPARRCAMRAPLRGWPRPEPARSSPGKCEQRGAGGKRGCARRSRAGTGSR